MKPNIITSLIALGLLLTPLVGHAAEAPVDLETQSVALSNTIKIGDRIGHIRFLGMLTLPDITRGDVRMSQLSGLAWDDDDGILYAISDKGGLFHLQPIFKDKILVGLRLLRAMPLRAPGSDRPLEKKRADAEGLDIVRGRNRRKGDAELLVSFERFPRIVRYRTDGRAISEHYLPAPLNSAKNYRDANMMLESVCVEPTLGIITVPEAPLRSERAGYTRLFGLSGKSWLFPVTPGDRVTDMQCPGKDEVLILQQDYRYTFSRIVVMLKRLRLTEAPASQILNPETLLSMSSEDGFHIDNFEGLAHHQGRRFFMVSDNNDLFVQRSLLLYFDLLDDR